MEAMVNGTPVRALCGKVWVPSRDPSGSRSARSARRSTRTTAERLTGRRAAAGRSDVRRGCRSAGSRSLRAGQRLAVRDPEAFAGESGVRGRCRMPPLPAVQRSRRCGPGSAGHWSSTCGGSDDDFLAVATPGAGKTTFALRIAAELLAAGTVEAVTVVTPTEHLKSQWADAGAAVGIELDPAFRNADVHTSTDFHGAVVTYAQVGAAPAVHRRRTMARPTLVDPRRDPPRRRLAVLGRRGQGRVRARRAAADAHRHPVPLRREPDPVRHLRARPRRPAAVPLRLLLRVRRRPGRRRRAAGHLPRVLGRDPLAHLGRRRAGRPAGRAGDPGRHRAGLADRARPDRRLDAAGAAGRRRAPAGAARGRHPRRRRAGHRQRPDGRPGVREAPGRHHRREGRGGALRRRRAPRPASPRSPPRDQRWMVAVRMVSEGVDIPRLAVGVYATSASTPLFFAQAIGRFVRVRRPGETATRLPAQRAAPAGAGQRDGGPARPRARRPKDEGRLRRRPAGAGRSARRRPATS